MRITNQNQTPVPSFDTNTNAVPASGNEPTSPTTPHLFDSSATSGLTPSFEMRSLTAALQQLPSVRDEAVAATLRRLAAGQLNSPAAVQATANAILGG
jgi:hypothetical protein